MKRLPLLVLTPLLAVAPVFAQDDSSGSSPEILQNPTFTDGTTHWHGDCKPAGSDMTQDFTSSNNAPGGITVDLHSSSWTNVTQELRDKAAPASVAVTITYQVSSDFKLSDHAEDYGNCAPNVGFGGANVPAEQGKVVVFVDVPPLSRSSISATTSGNTLVTIYNDHVAYSEFAPATDQTPQTYTVRMFVPPPTPDSHQTLCLAFPPGSGSITITKISMVPAAGGGPGDVPHPHFRPPGFPGGPPNPGPQGQ
jgi:hypothetical protein